jgi:hypothetical protein
LSVRREQLEQLALKVHKEFKAFKDQKVIKD